MEAEQYRRMAATARMPETRHSLLKLADRIGALADHREREADMADPNQDKARR
jgi:hypothetical protein